MASEKQGPRRNNRPPELRDRKTVKLEVGYLPGFRPFWKRRATWTEEVPIEPPPESQRPRGS